MQPLELQVLGSLLLSNTLRLWNDLQTLMVLLCYRICLTIYRVSEGLGRVLWLLRVSLKEREIAEKHDNVKRNREREREGEGK